jgi:hypothetical protein
VRARPSFDVTRGPLRQRHSSLGLWLWLVDDLEGLIEKDGQAISRVAWHFFPALPLAQRAGLKPSASAAFSNSNRLKQSMKTSKMGCHTPLRYVTVYQKASWNIGPMRAMLSVISTS